MQANLLKVLALATAIWNAIKQLLDGQKQAADELAAIKADVQRILDILTEGVAAQVLFSWTSPDGTKHEGEKFMADTFRADQQVTATIAIDDIHGNPAAVDGVPVWASSNPTVATVTASADGMTAVVAGVAPGKADIAVTADADLGTGVTPIVGKGTVTITAGQAAVITLTFSDPTSQTSVNPPPPPPPPPPAG